MAQQQILIDSRFGSVAIVRLPTSYAVITLDAARVERTRGFALASKARAWATARKWAAIIEAREVAAEDAAAAEYARVQARKAAPCPRCEGASMVDRFPHVQAGVCFACGRTAEEAQRRQVQGAAAAAPGAYCNFVVGSEWAPEENHHEPVFCDLPLKAARPQPVMCPAHVKATIAAASKA